MSRFLLVAHPTRAEAIELARLLDRQLRVAGHSTWMPDAVERGLADIDTDGDPATTDFVIALGGDGTMLHAVHALGGVPVPIVGVNLGNLGYLTEVEPDQATAAIERVLQRPADGRWTIDERMMLDVVVVDESGRVDAPWRALNEAVLEKQQTGHTVSFEVRIDGEAFTTFAADGMIVSTPTGSTAYSMSARGPIVSPKHRAMLVTPVAPHMLFDRSLVLDPSETIELAVTGERSAAIAVDGRLVAQLSPGSTVRCKPSECTARFVRFGDHSYHQVLKTKFGLADR